MDIEDSKGTRPDLKITNFNNLGKEMSTTQDTAVYIYIYREQRRTRENNYDQRIKRL